MVHVLPHNTCICHCAWSTHSHFGLFCWMASNSLASLILSSIVLRALCTSTLCTQVNICSLVVFSMSSYVATSLNISPVMSSSLNPPINYSVNNLTYSLYLHLAPFVQSSKPLLGRLIPLLCNFQYCNEMISQSWEGLNLLLRTENNPFMVLYFCFSLCECFYQHRPSKPSPFLITRTFSSWIIL